MEWGQNIGNGEADTRSGRPEWGQTERAGNGVGDGVGNMGWGATPRIWSGRDQGTISGVGRTDLCNLLAVQIHNGEVVLADRLRIPSKRCPQRQRET